MQTGNGQLSVPPGFRFHPTDEELLYYYLRKKVSFDPIDLDVIRDVDLNRLEPWDLNDRCGVGSTPQNEWYFFCHKDKKYPTGTRTNRATGAGFWKSTGRDKAIHLGGSQRIGMRKTLVFYTGRAPHGHKTDWIMHEFRLDQHDSDFQEDGWVVCKVFKKKTHQRGPPSEASREEDVADGFMPSECPQRQERERHLQMPYDFSFDSSMQLPQLLSSWDSPATPAFLPLPSLKYMTGTKCPQNLMKPTSAGGGMLSQHEKLHADWSILDKLLASHQQYSDQIIFQGSPSSQTMGSSLPVPRYPLQYFGCELDHLLKLTK